MTRLTQDIIDSLSDKQIVRVETVFNKACDAIIHKGEFKTYPGSYFYLMPVGETHAGASITKNMILSITPLN